jgi:hypothetical protein
MKGILRFILSLTLGCIVAVATASAAVMAARELWPEYAAAEPHKHYTLTMLFVRLAVGALGTAVAACATTIVAGDKGRAAWWLGALFFLLSLPDHVYPGYALNDYPVWYHVTYLLYLVPVAVLSARLFRSLIPGEADVSKAEIA